MRWSDARVVAISAVMCACVLQAVAGARLIIPYQHWTDTNGNRIEAHGGGFLWDRITNATAPRLYWYGESKKEGGNSYHAVNCYSAPDVSGPWTFEGQMLGQQDITAPFKGPYVVERPKVLYNAKTKKYVMWFHLDSTDYNSRYAGVATATSPRGPFSFVSALHPDGRTSMDMNMYAEDDGTAYFIRAIDNVATSGLSRLTDDYLNTQGLITTHSVFEGMSIFKLPDGTYYIIGSHLTGWNPNPLYLFRVGSSLTVSANSWVDLGNPTNSGTSYNSQPTYVFPYQDKMGKRYYIYMGDDWVMCGSYNGDLVNACYVWLPITINGQKFTINSRTQWDLDDPFNEYSNSTTNPGACGTAAEGSELVLTCDSPNAVMTAVTFASYGTPVGGCLDSFQAGSCARDVTSLITSTCLNKHTCSLTASNSNMGGDPCSGTGKTLAVSVTCSGTAPPTVPPAPRSSSTGPAPPSPATTICATAAEGRQATLSCPAGKAITAITFASYGTPSGSCPSFSTSSSCHASSSLAQVQSACVGKSSCVVTASNDVFGDPCSGRGKTLDIAAQCS